MKGASLNYNFTLTSALFLIIISCNSENRDIVIGLNENIHHDDFEYCVIRFQCTGSLNESPGKTANADTNYYLVHFRVENRALRVEHKWDNTIGYIVDGTGKIYENSAEDQMLLDKTLHFGWREKYTTYSGTSDSTILVFKLPYQVKNPYLMVRGSILMGDVLDGVRFRKIKVELF
jgi:hypothetical protein